MVSRQSGNALAGTGSIKADAYEEAGAFCMKKGRTLNVLKSEESKPPYILGNYPRAEVEFTCVTSK